MKSQDFPNRATTGTSRTSPLRCRQAKIRHAVEGALVETLEGRRLLSFSPAAGYAAGDDPRSIVVADLNGDTRPDLALANKGSSTVSVLLGNANGTFQPAQNWATGIGPQSIAVGDFNGDGKRDLVTANGSDLSVLLNNGAGGFGAPVSASLAGSPLSVAVGDVNADGKLDLVATSSNYFPPYSGYWGYYPGYHYSYATVLLGNGTGAFAPGAAVSLGSGSFTALAAGDFNGDGKADLAATGPDASYALALVGTSTGALTSAGYLPAGSSRSLAAGDLNGDGKADVVATSASADLVNVLVGTGSGTFGAAQSYATGSSPTAAAIADFNGDGKADLVTANAGEGNASVLLGLGTGAFQPPIPVGAGAASVAVAVGDFNGDGRPDAATAAGAADAAYALLNDNAWLALNAPKIAVGDITVTEGNTGTVSASFVVSLSAASTLPVTVKYATADGSATVAVGDYQAAAGTLTFAAGETTKTITVAVNGERTVENTETFSIRLSEATNAFLADATGTGTILDNEPRIRIEDASVVVEGNTGTKTMAFTVRLSAASDQPVTVNYSTVEGDTDWDFGGYYYYGPPPAATSGSDFQGQSNVLLTFAPGETAKTIGVVVNGDRVAESLEVFSVNLISPAGAGIDDGHAHGAIQDDEPYATIVGGSVVEGNSGTKSLGFTVSLSNATDVPVTVNYATADGSAAAGGDYQAKSGSVTIAAGQTSTTFTIAVNGDRLAESDETFYVNLTGATNAGISYASAYAFIQDDEPRLSMNDVSLKEGNSGTRTMTFTVTLAAAYDETVTVKYATQNGSATTSGNDYVAKSGTLTFSPGQTSKTITVTIKGDTKKEWDEYFYVVLSAPSVNAMVWNSHGYGTILNDDGRRR